MPIATQNIGLILYNSQHNEILLQRQENGRLSAPSSSYNALTPGHMSDTAASVIGEENYDLLVKTIHNYTNGVTKLEDTRSRQVLYLAPEPQEGELNIPNNCEWISMDILDDAIQSYIVGDDDKTTGFSTEFLRTARLLRGHDPESDIIRLIQQDGQVCGVVKGNPQNSSSIKCDLRDSGNRQDESSIDHEFCLDINPSKSTITLAGQTFEITIEQDGDTFNLEKTSGSFRKQFLTTVREALLRNAPEDQLAILEHISFNFVSSELQNVAFYADDPDNPISEVDSSEKSLVPFKDKLDELLSELNYQLMQGSSDIDPHGIRGIPREFQGQTCWLSSSIHLIMHFYGHRLEQLLKDKDYDDEQEDLAVHLLDLKRKVFKEVPEAVTNEDIRKLIELSQPLSDDFDWDLNVPHDPAEYLQLIRSYLDLENNLLEISAPIKPVAGAELEKVSVLEKINDAIDEDESGTGEFHVHIERNDASKKNSQPIEVKTRIKLANDEEYELVSAAIHHEKSTDAGHYTTYNLQSNTYYHCDDQNVTPIDSGDPTFIKDLSCNATDLIYRRVAPFDLDYEKAILNLHSNSPVDTKKWLNGRVIYDYAQQLIDDTGEDAKLLLNGSTAYNIGDKSNISQAEQAIQTTTESIVVIPTHKNEKHWTLLFVDKGANTIEYFDSVGREPTEDVEQLAQKLGYAVENVLDKDTKWQKDGWRCGYYTLKYLEERLNGYDASFISGIEELRPPEKAMITRLKVQLQQKYNRYNENYGFLAL